MKPAFAAGSASVRVPATSANLGPGFDALGLALSCYDDVSAHITDGGVSGIVRGEGAGRVVDETHLVVRAMRSAFARLGGQPAGIALDCTNAIPQGRGLGSSAAAIVAGVMLARALVESGDAHMSDADVLALAAEIEGHPDNVAACLLGGLTVAWRDDVAHAVRVDCSPSIAPVVFIPPFTASTEIARGLLPANVPHQDAAFASGRAALLIAALTGADEALLAATEDRLHQPYRAPAMPESAELVSKVREAGVAAVISGAGPTVLALTRSPAESATARNLVPEGWRVLELPISADGARVTPVTN